MANTIQTDRPKKVLIVISEAHSFPIKKSDGSTKDQPSGYFLMELAKPLEKLLDAGYDVEFASPTGAEPKPDPLSESTILAFLGNYWQKKHEHDLVEGKMKEEKNFKTPTPFADIKDENLRDYAGVFIPGGHAPLSDLGDNKELGRILQHFHDRHKPTAAICHGPYAFLSTQVSGEFAYKGYKITSWSDAEEKLMETLLWGEIKKVESSLREAGAEMVEGVGTALGSITVDREVVSGANPMAADALGDKFVQMLKGDGAPKA
ncbi:class I glutamine amidotransferase-like protein [Lophiostoma macrostomum CBS 122681]|uniref:D-lactate dehydratase n=1 Tax=Lophiostoma macrostomum CBS 122681 TaxID=1314788 RepID=A0A6A6SKS9_9PLEO|nr:class I glutamine amidotransferase-like protein [Lophiostoma macrostomum CBS 122681]